MVMSAAPSPRNDTRPPTQRRILIAAAALTLGVAGFAGMMLTKPAPPQGDGTRPSPILRVVEVRPQTVELHVTTNGTVAPRTQSDLIPEVSGTVTWVSPALVSGGFFEESDPLLRIDPRDYEVELERARASIARRTSEYDRRKKELDRQLRLAKQNVASATQLDDATSAERVAKAELRVAKAELARAERNLARTEILAPFTGRVREEQVGVGQFVDRGRAIGTIYAVDYAEVRLPVPDDQLAFLDLVVSRGMISEENQPEVRLKALFAGDTHEWIGRVVRTEGEIDPKSRMVHVIARFDDPYGQDEEASLTSTTRPPLAVGLFVEAEISGRRVENIIVLPRAALRGVDEVVIVDEENRLHLRHVDVLRTQSNFVFIRGGLSAGERAVTSDLDIVVEGMTVRPVLEGAEDSPRTAASGEPAS